MNIIFLIIIVIIKRKEFIQNKIHALTFLSRNLSLWCCFISWCQAHSNFIYVDTFQLIQIFIPNTFTLKIIFFNFAIDNDPSILSELESSLFSYHNYNHMTNGLKSTDFHYDHYMYDFKHSWNHHINSCIDSLSLFSNQSQEFHFK